MFQSLPDACFASPRDRADCAAAIRKGSRSFYAASLFLPASVRGPAYGLYAFCRLSDDAIDLGNGSHDALARLQTRLAQIYDGQPAIAADRAMADVVRRFALPRALPEALLDGLAWDAEGRRYESLPDLLDYAARVAGTVGAMMTLIMGVRAPDVLARACDLGVAMQVTNIARDVGEDARAGRIYLPLEWLRASGINPDEFLREPAMSRPLAAVIERLLGVADGLYARALPGVAGLPLACRSAIVSAAYLYAEIGEEVRRLNYNSVAQRARVSPLRKVARLSAALGTAPFLRRGTQTPPLDSVSFLVDAVTSSTPLVKVHPPRAPIWDVKGQLLSVLDMWERLERAELVGEP